MVMVHFEDVGDGLVEFDVKRRRGRRRRRRRGGRGRGMRLGRRIRPS